MSFNCKICNRTYKSFQSLWNHNNKFHNNIQQIESSINNNLIDKNKIIINNNTNETECKFCKVIFSNKSSLKRHINRCKIKKCEDDKIKQENELLKKQIESHNNEINMLKEMILKLINDNCKVHPKTLTKINKQLNNINNGTINNNNIVNNNVIIQFGNEALCDFLTDKQKMRILNSRHDCLNKLVKYIHFNDKYPQFKNILITNIKDDLAYRFDSKENKFIAIDKSTLIDNIISERMGDITIFYNELSEQLDPKTKEIIETIMDKMVNDEKFINNKKKDIKLIIYNNRDKVSKEITQDLEIIV